MEISCTLTKKKRKNIPSSYFRILKRICIQCVSTEQCDIVLESIVLWNVLLAKSWIFDPLQQQNFVFLKKSQSFVSELYTFAKGLKFVASINIYYYSRWVWSSEPVRILEPLIGCHTSRWFNYPMAKLHFQTGFRTHF